jgi:uncharacterized protein YchJ
VRTECVQNLKVHTKELSFSARFSTVGFSSNFSQPQKAQNGADISIFLKIQTVQI